MAIVKDLAAGGDAENRRAMLQSARSMKIGQAKVNVENLGQLPDQIAKTYM